MEISEKDLYYAYLAGFFDGEGHCRIHKNNAHTGRPSGLLEVGLTQINPTILNKVQEEFGGTVYYDTKSSKVSRPIYRWKLTGQQAIKFLKAIDKYIVIKRQALTLAYEFQEFKDLHNYSKKDGNHFGRPSWVIDKEIEYINQSLDLHKRGIKNFPELLAL